MASDPHEEADPVWIVEEELPSNQLVEQATQAPHVTRCPCIPVSDATQLITAWGRLRRSFRRRTYFYLTWNLS